MATHSSTLAWKFPWTENPGRLKSMGSQIVGHDWATSFTYLLSLKQSGWKTGWMPSSIAMRRYSITTTTWVDAKKTTGKKVKEKFAASAHLTLPLHPTILVGPWVAALRYVWMSILAGSTATNGHVLSSHTTYVRQALCLLFLQLHNLRWDPALGVLPLTSLLCTPASISFHHNFLSSVQLSCSFMFDSATPWTAARQASLSITNSQSLLKLMSSESEVPSNHLILCRPLLLLPSIFPNIRVFSNESVLCIRWPKHWSFSFSISPSNECSGLISFRIDWLDLHAVQGTLKSLLQHHSSKASILRCSAFFMVQLSHPYMTTGKL